jgi:hypothetical protein
MRFFTSPAGRQVQNDKSRILAFLQQPGKPCLSAGIPVSEFININVL